jgi:hypothetical protein
MDSPHSRALPIETALSLCGRHFPASQRHGLEYALVPERRFLIRLLLLLQLSGRRVLLPVIIVFACIHRQGNPDLLMVAVHRAPVVALRPGKTIACAAQNRALR